VGAAAWADSRYWFHSKHNVGLGAVTALASEIAQVLAAATGMARKVVVLDLDGTIWGGVVGEDGAAGVVIGDGPDGEAFQAFQEYLLQLQRRGMLLVAVSKNNEADARAPFLERPEMRLTLDSFAAFLPSWDEKPDRIARVAEELGLGLDSFVFVDDNPVERESVRRALPDVGIVPLPPEPAGYVAALAAFPGMQVTGVTEEDARRTEQYRSRAAVARMEATAGTREDFLAELEMVLTVEEVGEATIARVTQLIGKTNQFNLTGRRHTAQQVLAMTEQAGSVTLALRLRDRYSDHGLIGVVLALPDGEDLVVDTWLMSCRVLGRDLEPAVMSAVAARAATLGYARVVGHFVPTARNAPARKAYPAAGFRPSPGLRPAEADDGAEAWVLDLREQVPGSPFIRIEPRPLTEHPREST
jgi:FkbH-like protein